MTMLLNAFSAISNKSQKTYYLHSRLTANGSTKLYFFGKEIKDGVEYELPAGYEVSENPRTGLPILRKVKV